MDKKFIFILLLFVISISGCLQGVETPTIEENVTEAPEFNGHNYTNVSNIDSIENLPEGFGWVAAEPDVVASKHSSRLRSFDSFKVYSRLFIQGGAQLVSGSENHIDYEDDKAFSGGEAIFTDNEYYITGDKKYTRRNFTDNHSVYEVTNVSSDNYGLTGTGDVRMIFNITSHEIEGRVDEGYLYDIRGIKSRTFMGFNNSEINSTRGFILLNKTGFVREIEMKVSIKGEPVQVTNNTSLDEQVYLDRQVYFHYKVDDINNTEVKAPDWFIKLRERYSPTRWFNDEDIIA